MIRTRAHLHLLHRGAQQIFPRVVDGAEFSYSTWTHVTVALEIRPSKPLVLPILR